MRMRLVLLASLLAVAIGAGQTSIAHAAPAAAAKTCSAGYVHANLSWGEKCLRAGEFCKVANAEYRRYGYTCPVSGHLVRSQVLAPAKTPAPAHPSGATAKCNDGTFSYSAHHSGSCSHHGGVAVFYG
jgi:hypothetical protein